MVSVKNVYSTVLYLANKEQRGYIGPDEFNKYAMMAQLEIFEGYFAELAHFAVSQKGMIRDTGYSDLSKNLRMKIDIFADNEDLNLVDGRFELPETMYRLDTVAYKPSSSSYIVIPEMSKAEGFRVLQSPLMGPSETFPKYQRYGLTIEVYPTTITENVEAQFIKMPVEPYWAYNDAIEDITGDRFYDADASVDFDLHPSEEFVLIKKILEFAGVSTKQADIAQFASQSLSEEEQIKRT